MKLRLTNEQIIRKFTEKHGDKFDYSKVNYTGYDDKLEIVCKKHGSFFIRYHGHKRNDGNGGCHQCRNETVNKNQRLPQDEFIKRANLKYNNFFNYSSVEYNGFHRKVTIICPIHGEFDQNPAVHLNSKYGCPACALKNNGYNAREGISYYIKLFNKIYNHKYTYDVSTIENEKDVTDKTILNIKCPKHGWFSKSIAVHRVCGCPKCGIFNKGLETIVHSFLDKHNIVYIKNDRKILEGKELDIFIPSLNLGIECNGLYWHSQIIRDERDGDKYADRNKLELCQQKDISLLQIYDCEILKKTKIVFSRLKSILGLLKYKIYARKCHIKEIDAVTKNKFLTKYHIQGADKSQKNLGLFYKNRLVSVMTFCKPRVALGHKNIKHGTWELSRFCNIANFSIIGGASKLFKFFTRKELPNTIISYADRRWSVGHLYENLGFSLKHNSRPNYWYFIRQERKLYHRYNFRKSHLSEVLDKFNPELSEWENMKNNGWNRIWDCGNKVYEWNK